MVIVSQHRVVQLGQVADPADAALDLRVVRLVARDLVVGEEVHVARGRDRFEQIRQVLLGLQYPVRMGGNRCHGQKEREIWVTEGLVEQSKRFVRDHVGRVLARVAGGLSPIARHPRIPILVGVRVEQEIGSIETFGVGSVVVVDRVEVVQLAGVVRVVAGLLHPHKQILVVEPLRDHLGISAVGRRDVGDVVVVSSQTRPECRA